MELPSILDGPIACDLETDDKGLNEDRGPGWAFKDGGETIGVAIHTHHWSGYAAIAHTSGNTHSKEQVSNWLNYHLGKEEGPPVIFANAQYDLGWLEFDLGVKVRRRVEDVQFQAPLVDEHKLSYSLDRLAKEYMGAEFGKLDDEIVEAAKKLGYKKSQAKSVLKYLPVDIVGKYAVMDVGLTRGVWDVLRPEITKQELDNVYNLELDLLPLLVATRKRGVRVDLDGAERTKKYLRDKQRLALAEIKDATGIDLTGDLWKSGAVAKVLDHIQVPYPLTPKTQKPSIDKDYLNRVDHAVASMILRARKYERAEGTFVDEYILGYGGRDGGRIHCQLNPLKGEDGGTVSGRFSCTDPNLQQIPSADRDPEIGKLMRSLFLPEEGCLWGSLDFSQQEPRWMVEYAHRLKLPSAAPALNAYLTDPKTDFHTMTANLTGLPRKRAKIINLGLAYGMGGGKLCRSLGLPVIEKTWRRGGKEQVVEMAGVEGQEILRLYNEGAPFIKDLSEKCKSVAKSRGFLRTHTGRRFRFPVVNGERWRTHKAMNALIQGVAADETKTAMVLMWKEGIMPALSIHDEVALTDKASAADCRRAVEIMLTALPKTVPSKVDLEMGPNWGECTLQELDMVA